MITAEIIGYVAGILIAITLLPQIHFSLKTKNVEGLSLEMLIIFATSMILWVFYGYLINSYPLMLTNGFATLVAFLQLYVKIKYSK